MLNKGILIILLIPIIGGGIITYFLDSFNSIEEQLVSDQQELFRHTIKLKADLLEANYSLEKYIEQQSPDHLAKLNHQYDLVILRVNVLTSIAAQFSRGDQALIADLRGVAESFDKKLQSATRHNKPILQKMLQLIEVMTEKQQKIAANYDRVIQKNILNAAESMETQSIRILIVFALFIVTLMVVGLQLIRIGRDRQGLKVVLSTLDSTNHNLEQQIIERRKAEEALKHVARHDSLTGLYNRAVFLELLASEINRSRRSGSRCAVLFLDLDGFKEINDKYGHEAGDQALIEISRRFLISIREVDFVARIGGDEFTMLLPDIEGSEAVTLISQRIFRAVSKPVHYKQLELKVTVSIGAAFSTEQIDDAFELIRLADIAMYQAKSEGENQIRFSELLQFNN